MHELIIQIIFVNQDSVSSNRELFSECGAAQAVSETSDEIIHYMNLIKHASRRLLRNTPMHEGHATVNPVILQTDMLHEQIQQPKDPARTCETTPWQQMMMLLESPHHGRHRLYIRWIRPWYRRVFLKSI